MADNGDSAETNETGAGNEVTVHIRQSNGSTFSVQTRLDSTVAAFKGLVAEKSDIPADQQRLIYKGRVVKDEPTLESYGLQAEHTVHVVRGLPAASTNTNTTNSGGSTTTPAAARGVNFNESGGLGGATLGASFFPGGGVNGLGDSGVSGMLGAGIPELEQVQQQLTQNPNMMREVMNMPVVQNLLNNPDLIHNLIMGNPQLREIMDRNPELAHVLNDPGTLRQTLEAARNPELMREMMRNTDRAMSNIESSPEGFNMLRRMYENVQEPFLNATILSGESENNTGSNPFAALLGNQGASQARDPSSPSDTSTVPNTGSPVPNTNPLPNPWSTASRGRQANTTTRSTLGGDSRATGIAGLGGLGLPGMERMFGGMNQDPTQLNQLMQNPAVSQMMQSLMSNPQYMNHILGLSPQLRSMVDSNPQLREMMQNPEFLRQLSSPETLQQAFALQQTLLSPGGRQQPTQDSGQTGGGTGTPNNMGLDALMNMFNGLGLGGLSVPNTSNEPPEQLYATQLAQLQEMGFFDTQENIRALRATAGNVHAAVERLLGNLGQ